MSGYRAQIRPTLALALPMIVGNVGQMLIGVTDSIMIGQVGTVPLAASAFAGSVFGVFFIVGIGLLTSVTVLVSRDRGAGRLDGCASTLRHGLAVALVVSVLEAALLTWLSRHAGWFGQPPEVVAAVNPYFVIIAWSLVPTFLFLTAKQFCEALDHATAPMVVTLGNIGLNIALNWILIYGHLGAPALGLAGAGIATLITRTVGLVVLVWWMYRQPDLRDLLPRSDTWRARLSLERLREMAHLGVPAAAMLLCESCAFAGAALMMGWLGAVPLAAHQIALSCAALTFMFPLGISSAASIRVSAARGAGDFAVLRPIGFSALGLGAVIMGTFAVIFVLGGREIAALFVDDPPVIELAARLLVVAAMFQLFDGAQVIGSGALRGLLDVKIPTLITIVAYWGIALPGGYGFGVRGAFGAMGIWSALAAGLAVAAVFLALRFARLTRGTAVAAGS